VVADLSAAMLESVRSSTEFPLLGAVSLSDIQGFLPARRRREMPTKIVGVAPKTAKALRDLSRQATEAYAVFEGAQRELRKRCSDLTGPISSAEFPALSRDDDRIEVVSLAEYLSDTHKGRWC
jgi:hypothetical protein